MNRKLARGKGFLRIACFRVAGLTVVPAVAVGVVEVAPAAAQDQAALAKVTELNRKALEAYDNLEPAEARKLLLQALEVCATAGLATHPLKARTHLHLGAVLMGGFKQRDAAVKQFKRALEIQPDIKLTKALVSPEVQGAFDEAKGGARTGSEPVAAEKPATDSEANTDRRPDDTAASGDRPPSRFKGLYHRPVTEAASGKPIAIKVAAADDLEFDRLIVAYRPEGASDFLQRTLQKNDSGWYVGRIPEVATQGGIVSYYIEARAKGDKTVASNGSAAEPHVVTVGENAGDVASGSGRRPGAVAERSEDEQDAAPSGSGLGSRPFWVGVGVGTGYGWAKGTTEVTPRDDKGVSNDFSGLAPASIVHFTPEVGYFIAPTLMLTLQGRVQLVSGGTTVYDAQCAGGTCAPAKAALAVLAKGTWLLGTGSSAWRPFASAALGLGELRHLVTIKKSLVGCGGAADRAGYCKDTVKGGPVLAGGGGGIAYTLTQNTVLIAEAQALVGIPNATVNLDVDVGFAVGF